MVGLRAFLVALLVLALPASASLLEEVSDGEVSYQFDGATHHDAPDACDEADPAWGFAAGTSTDGLLLPPDDMSDVFVMDVAPEQVGHRLKVSLFEGAEGVDLMLDILAPLCDGDVFAPHNQPLPPPSPPVPAAGEKQASLDRTAEPMYCRDTDEWAFAIDLDGATPPASIYAAWTDGTHADLPLAWSNPQFAVYGPGTADVVLEGAWANLPASWSGTFALFSAPCDVPDGGAIYGQPAFLGNDWISFTPVRAGPHEVVVSLGEPDVPTSIPASCHWCLPQVEMLAEKAQYQLSSTQA